MYIKVARNKLRCSTKNKPSNPQWQPGTQRSGVTGVGACKVEHACNFLEITNLNSKRQNKSHELMYLTPVTPFATLSAFPAAILVPCFRSYWFEDIL